MACVFGLTILSGKSLMGEAAQRTTAVRFDCSTAFTYDDAYFTDVSSLAEFFIYNMKCL